MTTILDYEGREKIGMRHWYLMSLWLGASTQPQAQKKSVAFFKKCRLFFKKNTFAGLLKYYYSPLLGGSCNSEGIERRERISELYNN